MMTMNDVSVPSYLSPRASGILLHVSSLPGPYGMGELGLTAEKWLDLLAAMNQKCWQVLPLNPIGYGHSPYQSTSAMAFNVLFVSLEQLRNEELLLSSEFDDYPQTAPDRVEYDRIIDIRYRLLRKAAERFFARGDFQEYSLFSEREAAWLNDFVLFEVLKERYPGQSWAEWPEEFRSRNPVALQKFREEFASELSIHRVWQYFFHSQWQKVRAKAAALEIKIIGDLPIFVAHDSADVWASPELFDLQEDGSPRVVAGVPPDYFSSTGQRWGNPLYRWQKHAETNYGWWSARLRHSLDLYDLIRIDHFRGFVDYWEIPAREETAVHGQWIHGPGIAFFKAVEGQLGKMPLIAEDLGIIGQEVIALRDNLGIPGLRILLFAFDDDNEFSPFLPKNFAENAVAYTGTHDNDTILGVFGNSEDSLLAQIAKDRRRRLYDQLPEKFKSLPLNWQLLAWIAESAAQWVLFPMQDVLGLDVNSRMNIPGRPHGNWQWKMTNFDISEEVIQFMREIGKRSAHSFR